MNFPLLPPPVFPLPPISPHTPKDSLEAEVTQGFQNEFPEEETLWKMFLMAGNHPKESHRAAGEIRTEAEQTGGGGVLVTQSTGSQVTTDHHSGRKVSSGGNCVLTGAFPLLFRAFLRGYETEYRGRRHPKGFS